MNTKKISLIITLIMIIAIVATTIVSYADTQETIYVNLSQTDSNGFGYAIGNPNNGVTDGQAAYIFNINTYTSSDGSTLTNPQRNLYCVKAHYGASWENNVNASIKNVVSYNLSYDLQTQKEELLNKIVGDTAGNVVKELLNEETGYYNEILWILDNAYIEGKTDYDEFWNKTKLGITEEGYTKKYSYKLTEKDIKAIQKAAIWYFTNKDEEVFNKLDASGWLYVTTENLNGSYVALDYLTRNTETPTVEGEERAEQAEKLYKYFITEATKNSEYVSPTSAPISINGTVQDDGEYIINTTRVENKYIVGPIKINKNNDLEYSIKSLEVKDQNGNAIEFKYREQVNGEDKQEIDIESFINSGKEFYISIDRNTVNQMEIKINAEYKITEKTLWLSGEEDTNAITLNGEQPLVELENVVKPLTLTLVSEPEEFDLALRKYIVAINDIELKTSDGKYQREPNIVEDSLNTDTTATYKHRKDPVVVKDEDEVTYQITIYNEGNKEGFASKIIDQLPVGLIATDTNPSEITATRKDGKPGNTYSLTHSLITDKNQVILTIKDNNTAQSLKPYTSTDGLDYETIEIKCTVKQEPDIKNNIILTNVAWIDMAYDSEANVEILAQEYDRDSQPSNMPQVTKDNINHHIGHDDNKKDLTDSEYHYKGKQDDDDFEKLVIEAVPKKFDLALFKHIAAVSKDQTFEAGEFVTDTGNIDGKYLRAPEAKRYDEASGEIIYEYETEGYSKQSKQPLSVEPGDYVLYTIRVYNEGELDGYASEIKDRLPKGLNFVESNETYNGIWALDRELLLNEGVQEVSTTAFAKDDNATYLLKAFKTDAEINDENPDYIDAQVLCQVAKDAESNVELINYAQITEDTDKNGEPIDDDDSDTEQWKDGDDDQDIEKVKVQRFDLSLRKFITSVNGQQKSRVPQVNVQPLKDGENTATYTHSKIPVAVQPGDKVIYTIRVYNEGDINGYASEVKDYLPPYLKYVKDSEINKKYGWSISEDGRIATTTYLANTELKAFDVKNGTQLDSADVQIECLVSDEVPLNVNQTNIAEISEYKYNGNVVSSDRDSTSDNMTDKNTNYMPEDSKLPTYKDEVINNPYVEGNEDDDDFEKVYVKEFDLALRKFITKVQETDVTTRVPQPKIENGIITYEHTKDPLIVHVGDTVIYTLRIYNEGEIDGFASEITDDIPEYLEYLPEDSTNVEYMWKMYDENGAETEKVEEAVKVKTEYLSKDNGEDNLIKAYDGKTLSYKDIKIAFKVKDPNSNTYIITNYAQISDDTDINGNEIDDSDSITDKWNEGEDDQDIENVKVEYFDLSLLKFVTKVIVTEDGKETITKTGYNGHEDPEPVVKVELHKKKLNKVVVKFGYGITITNEGDIPGYATEITDYVPEGLKFEPADNPQWTDEGNNVISTRQLEGVLLQPGESKTIEVIFTWINGSDNLALKTNTAEISEDKNEYDVPDRDSVPDNKVEGEDDIDIAKVILAISTGRAQTYFTLTLGLLVVMVIGIALIRKFVI